MSLQLESAHFFMGGDQVENLARERGEITEAFALYAQVRWESGRVEELEQFDPGVVVVERAERV